MLAPDIDPLRFLSVPSRFTVRADVCHRFLALWYFARGARNSRIPAGQRNRSATSCSTARSRDTRRRSATCCSTTCRITSRTARCVQDLAGWHVLPRRSHRGAAGDAVFRTQTGRRFSWWRISSRVGAIAWGSGASATSSITNSGAAPPMCRGHGVPRCRPLPRHPSQLYQAALEGAALS